jgi:hypothetical protein
VNTLEERIASALSANVASSYLEALVAEVENAAAAAEEAAVEARKHALDPTVTDPNARTALTDAEFARDRLQNALPRLQARQRGAAAAELSKAWVLQYDKVVAEQRALAAELAALYPPFEVKIVDLLSRAQKADNRASHLSFTKPSLTYDDGRWALRTEEMAREGHAGGLSILKDMKLPSWSGSSAAWPPWLGAVWAQVAASYVIPPIAATPEQGAARDAIREAEAERTAEFYRRQERAREEREAAEARAARERDIERRRQAGWG